jgi:hypothetical protein
MEDTAVETIDPALAWYLLWQFRRCIYLEEKYAEYHKGSNRQDYNRSPIGMCCIHGAAKSRKN